MGPFWSRGGPIPCREVIWKFMKHEKVAGGENE